GRWPGREEAAVYRFHSSANGTRYAYVNCVTLPGEADTMTILFVTPAESYDTLTDTRDDLISRISLSI
ncbi:MAG TPA: hypothetical protein VD767_00905, partial [Thermomicrobiales bacterium]|nr:hypothetical protein [Thermomicrobiales bacterium]